ncbi:MAG: glutathione S-transferase family protein [Gammaproteobacteria bacterium]|nr:glutathione S-transferase family protein [Gammaproteobacteria bacterium]
MIDLYTYGTFNGRRASIMLEETGFTYNVHKVDLMKGEQKQAEFLALNPSGRIPAIIDHDNGTGEPIVLSQSVAILFYLAEKSGRLMPSEPKYRAQTYEWLSYHATDIAPNLFNIFYFSQLCKPPQQDAVDLLRQRNDAHYTLFDQHLADNEYLGGNQYSIADIAVFPAMALIEDETFKNYQHIQRWIQTVAARPAVQRGMAVPE